MESRLSRIVTIVALLLLAALALGCGDSYCDRQPAPGRLNSYTIENWNSRSGSGSCVVAGTCNLLESQGCHRKSDLLRRALAGAKSDSGIAADLDEFGIDYAMTKAGDMAWIDQACRTRRGAGFSCYVVGREGVRDYVGFHFLCLVRIDEQFATIREVNPVRYHLDKVPENQLFIRWSTDRGIVERRMGDTYRRATVLRYTNESSGEPHELTMTRSQFEDLWCEPFYSFAITPVYSPLPPPANHDEQ